ncbi:MAG: LytTR family DNA-binding domain-containing protein [Steroidobacteraceae bacterium]
MNALTPLRVVIADDELLARQRLQDLLATATDVTIVAQAESGAQAVQAIREQHPDIVFLDVQMPRMNAFQVISEIGAAHMPVIVLVTAFDQYALQAFEAATLDYLLKPFTQQRFEQALQRAREAVRLRQAGVVTARLMTALQAAGMNLTDAGPAPPGPHYYERLAVESRSQVRVVEVADIDYICASGVYAELHVAGKTHVMRESLQHLQEKLDPRRFFRIHRSTIVQLDRIDLLLREAGGDYTLKLKDGTQLTVSRMQVKELERWMGTAPEPHR